MLTVLFQTSFAKELPRSLEELYLTIKGEGLTLERNTDFDPICELGLPIFKSLRRLHTCNIVV